MPCGYLRTTAVRIRHHVCRRAVQLSRLLSKSPAELHSGLSSSCSLPQTCPEVSAAPRFHYCISQISWHPECTSITAGVFRSTWDCSCRVWEHFAYLQGGLGAYKSIYKHWWGRPECLGGLHAAPRPIYIFLMPHISVLLGRDRDSSILIGALLCWDWHSYISFLAPYLLLGLLNKYEPSCTGIGTAQTPSVPLSLDWQSFIGFLFLQHLL